MITRMLKYLVGPEQHLAFLTSEKAYQAHVEYWNDKPKEMKRAERRRRK